MNCHTAEKVLGGKKYVGAWIPKQMHTALKKIAAADNRSLQYILNKLISRGVVHLMKDIQQTRSNGSTRRKTR